MLHFHKFVWCSTYSTCNDLRSVPWTSTINQNFPSRTGRNKSHGSTSCIAFFLIFIWKSDHNLFHFISNYHVSESKMGLVVNWKHQMHTITELRRDRGYGERSVAQFLELISFSFWQLEKLKFWPCKSPWSQNLTCFSAVTCYPRNLEEILQLRGTKKLCVNGTSK